MKQRSAEILQRLLKNPRAGLSAQQLTADYHITEKTLRKDIQEILDFAANGQLTFDGGILRLTHRKHVPALMAAITAMSPYDYKLSLEERKAYIIITLLAQEGYYSMQQLADELYVTRNTIINDCKVVGEYLTAFGIDFIARSKKGIRLDGTPEQVDLMRIDLFRALLSDLAAERSFFAQFIVRKCGFSFTLADVTAAMNEFVRARSLLFDNAVFFEIAVCIFVLLNTERETNTPETDSPLPPLPLDGIGQMIAHVARRLERSLTQREIHAMESIVMQRGLLPQAARVSDVELYGRICHFLLEIGRDIGVDVLADELLIQSLVAHVKSMENWKEADFSFAQEYASSAVFDSVRRIAEDRFPILAQYLPYEMTDKMKDSIVIHICAALLRSRRKNVRLRVLIACPGSMATGKYIEAQVRDYFSFHIVDTVSVKSLENTSTLPSADFIISTVALSSTLPVVTVSPLLTVDDIQRIQDTAFRLEQESGLPAAEEENALARIQRIYENGNAERRAHLNTVLEQLLADISFTPPAPHSSRLLSMLEPRYIRIEREPLAWHTAMRRAAEYLVRDGRFDPGYVEEAIQNVEEYGSYIIIARGIALAHARREAGVYEDGIGVLVSREGIIFDEGARVHLLFFFAQKEDVDSMPLFREIIQLGQTEEAIASLASCENPEALRVKIAEILAQR